MLELTITGDSAAELRTQIDALNAAFTGGTMPATAEAPKEPAKGKGKAAGPKADPVPDKAPETAQEPAQEPRNGIGYDKVQEAVVALHQAQGRDAVLKVLSQFDVDHGTKLVPEQYPAALQALGEALVA